MKDASALIDPCQRLRAQGKSDEEILSFLRVQECSKVQSIEILIKAFGLNLGQAKAIVHMSKAWADVRARDDQFHDSLERVLSFDRLLKLEQPWVFKVDESRHHELVVWLKTQSRLHVIWLNGNKMRTTKGFYDEISKKLGLPDYFGRNLNALDECLTDIDVLEGDAFVLLIKHGNQLLDGTDSESLEGVLDTFNVAGAEWSVPVNSGEPWNRPAKPFHVVIELENDASARLNALPDLLIGT